MYEALLSFTGFFAEQLKAYKAEEIAADPATGRPKCYPRASYIYRLAGRNRQKSASDYTPESLTQCLVQYALKELLPGKSAADILRLKVCEPAMGSAAMNRSGASRQRMINGIFQVIVND